MEKRLNKKTESYLTEFKDSIRNKLSELGFTENEKTQDLMEYIYEYKRLSFDKEDVNKRQRIKNCIPNTNRCNAKIANGCQCTRQRKDNHIYCGTHEKGTPHGVIDEGSTGQLYTKHDVFVQEVNGIVQYLDKQGNVYNTEHIQQDRENPEIIGRYLVDSNGTHQLNIY